MANHDHGIHTDPMGKVIDYLDLAKIYVFPYQTIQFWAFGGISRVAGCLYCCRALKSKGGKKTVLRAWKWWFSDPPVTIELDLGTHHPKLGFFRKEKGLWSPNALVRNRKPPPKYSCHFSRSIGELWSRIDPYSYLVGGCIPTPLKNDGVSSSIGMIRQTALIFLGKSSKIHGNHSPPTSRVIHCDTPSAETVP